MLGTWFQGLGRSVRISIGIISRVAKFSFEN
jgi:hypothetical protein